MSHSSCFANCLRVLFAHACLGACTILAADEPRVKSSVECRLMINWDQIDMCGLQLTRAHRHQQPTAESVKAMIEQIVDEHARAKIDRIVHCVFALPRGTVPGGFQSFYRDQITERLFEDTPVGFEDPVVVQEIEIFVGPSPATSP